MWKSVTNVLWFLKKKNECVCVCVCVYVWMFMQCKKEATIFHIFGKKILHIKPSD